MMGFLRRPPVVAIIVAGCLISFFGYGVRASFGLFLEPMTVTRGWDRETFALAMAIQNIIWGFGVPIAGALADRFGPILVMVIGSVAFAIGMYFMSIVEAPVMFYLVGGLVTGLGVAFSSFSLAMAAMAKVVSPSQRSLAMGAGASAGSFGQVLFSPLSLVFIEQHGWEQALVIMSIIVLAIIPLAILLPKGGPAASVRPEQELKLTEALKEALNHRGYMLLTAGFFVCGFHVAFIGVHFPAFVEDQGLPASVGAYALSIVGLFNIFGAFLGGWFGQKYSKKSTLSVIYLLRGFVITFLVLSPPTELTMYTFAVCMGMLWLSTVPLTNAIVGELFGMQWLATLFGVVFLSHQLGSFLGIWLGGYMFDATGSYDFVWWCGVGLALVAAVLHWPIDETPVARISSNVEPAAVTTARELRTTPQRDYASLFVIASGVALLVVSVAMQLLR
jgi:MFS family permease